MNGSLIRGLIPFYRTLSRFKNSLVHLGGTLKIHLLDLSWQCIFKATVGISICTLISDLRNQGLFQTLEFLLGSVNPIFSESPPWKNLYLYHKLEKKSSGGHPEKIQVLKTRSFFRVATLKNLRCHPQNPFSECRLKGWV